MTSAPNTLAKAIRMTAEEDRCLRRAMKLLQQPLSQITQAAVVDAAYKLGFCAAVKVPPRPYRGVWPDAPERREETTSTRTTANFDPWSAQLLTRAAAYVDVGETTFVLGATFRYLADLKRVDGEHGPLAKLTLPAKYGT